MMIARSTLAFCLASAALAQTTYTISTPIGGTTGLSVPTYSGTPRQIGGGTNLGLDSSGNVYFGDNVYQLLYEYSGGKISPFPQLGQSGIEAPAGIACDAAGNVYVTDGLQNYIDKFPPGALSAGFASVVAGSRGAAAFGGDNGPATQAMLNAPSGITLDSKGNIYFADTGNKRIRKISNGTITTIAGGGALPLNATNVGKAATSIAFTGPTGPAVDASGNVYLAESGNVYQVSAATGILSLVAGCLTGCTGTALQATATAVDSNGDLYIAEAFGYRIRVLHNGVLSTIAGTGVAGTSGDNGPSTSAQITRPYSIAVDSAFRVWVSTDSGIRLLTPASGASINTGGIVPINSTTPTVQTGSWVSIYGKNLASGTTVWNGDFPTTLGGVSVAIDSKPAYLWFTSPGQINVQVPDDATTGLVNVVVNTASGTATSSVMRRTLRA
jgi:sugar lactone lactonase YvrE